MTPAQFSALKATDVPKLVIFGVDDPQMSHADAARRRSRSAHRRRFTCRVGT